MIDQKKPGHCSCCGVLLGVKKTTLCDSCLQTRIAANKARKKMTRDFSKNSKSFDDLNIELVVNEPTQRLENKHQKKVLRHLSVFKNHGSDNPPINRYRNWC